MTPVCWLNISYQNIQRYIKADNKRLPPLCRGDSTQYIIYTSSTAGCGRIDRQRGASALLCWHGRKHHKCCSKVTSINDTLRLPWWQNDRPGVNIETVTGQRATRGHNAKWDLSGDQSAIVDRSHPSRISQQLQGSHKVQKSDCYLVINSLEIRNVRGRCIKKVKKTKNC